MTKLTQWLAGIIAFSAIWVFLMTEKSLPYNIQLLITIVSSKHSIFNMILPNYYQF